MSSTTISAPEKPSAKQPRTAFYFNTSEHLLRIGRQKANNFSELLEALRTCPDDSIFQHTFRTLQEHHFIQQGFSNDFAHWSLFACHEPVLAEQLASVDVREFTSIDGLRDRMVEIVDEFLKQHPRLGSQPALEPFYFCASDLLVLPTSFVADSLPSFVNGLRQVGIHSIQHHFIEARLRLHRMSNDFSQWLDEEAGLPKVADAIERIDIYTNTMEGVRQRIAGMVEQVLK
ncbi:MAG TPA: DUF5752 family protein [Verrucomicrobiae bacterium]|jgi:hypothetical protein|nr:DUF5752 family protein [Verrucomicrobiae bacterium]